MRYLIPFLFLAACASTPAEGPDVPERTEFGYQCSEDYPCPEDLRCYFRFPNSVGRCVTDGYYANNPRGCNWDQDCEATETCEGAVYPSHGVCRSRLSTRRAP